ncbi:hypothetical protein GCM10025876_10800 [Demequina litorisediminis]|uniref:Uncharacterized protein n=1 Tax=Demequina litorisediminis TaxID=1849022 RepID=A0ABQ6IC79_9MICO|nr:hypothetical protein GCM10025876_10800 [Demequina litorisediminis]
MGLHQAVRQQVEAQVGVLDRGGGRVEVDDGAHCTDGDGAQRVGALGVNEGVGDLLSGGRLAQRGEGYQVSRATPSAS